MASLPSQYLKSVVAIVYVPETAGNSVRQMGTGFLYGYPAFEDDDGNTQYRLFVVTCKHVIDDVMRLTNNLLVRFNQEEGQGTSVFAAPIVQDSKFMWTFHPSEDVAVLPINARILESTGVQRKFFGKGASTFTRQEAKTAGLYEGDGVFIIGFPTGWRPGSKDYPIVRYGVLAQVQGWYDGDHTTFLIDGSGFGGNSGGPVVNKPDIAGIGDTQPVQTSKLLGMVARVSQELKKIQEIELEQMALHSNDENGDKAKATGVMQHTDLITVIPVDLIEETVVLAIQQAEAQETENQEQQV